MYYNDSGLYDEWLDMAPQEMPNSYLGPALMGLGQEDLFVGRSSPFDVSLRQRGGYGDFMGPPVSGAVSDIIARSEGGYSPGFIGPVTPTGWSVPPESKKDSTDWTAAIAQLSTVGTRLADIWGGSKVAEQQAKLMAAQQATKLRQQMLLMQAAGMQEQAAVPKWYTSGWTWAAALGVGALLVGGAIYFAKKGK